MITQTPVTPTRFLPGAMIAERWRVVARLGQGGMGEVYRADDLRLGEPVALKFLPERLEHDAGLRERFLGEARLARKVAHPNVCRVYDVGEVGGRPFLSMEYVDGEDVGTLLSRIGRLPPDKAVQIAREICAGLAAAHAQGILHRDLKPSNVMLDGRGHARITDFGLAVWADGENEADALAGTPAYMAPEQLAGQAPSRASDVYALGLVLYEMFTGHRAFTAATWAEQAKQKQTTTPSHPSQLAPGIDPATERVILRCLAPDPAQRPGSAAVVAAALPGGDPLAAALAAGETPSPELVAAGAGADAISSRRAWGLLGVFAAAMVALLAWVPSRQLLVRAPLQKPPAVLLDRARALCDSLGWTDRRDDYSRLIYIGNTAGAIVHSLGLRDVGQASPEQFQLAFGLAYWASPTVLRPIALQNWTPLWADPPLTPGTVSLQMDGRGQLTRFGAMVPVFDTLLTPGPVPNFDQFARALGLADTTSMVRTRPAFIPPLHSDRRDAWRFRIPAAFRESVQVEVATHRGRLVSLGAITQAELQRVVRLLTYSSQPIPPAQTVYLWMGVVLVVIAGLAGLANLRRGRADGRGALRVAAALAGASLGGNLLIMHRAEGLATPPIAFWQSISFVATPFVFAAVVYLAFEPVLRQTWPHLMVGWMRLLDGRWRDTRVGSELLTGVSLGTATFVALYGVQAVWGRVSNTFLLPGALDDPGLATDTLMGGGWPWSQLLAAFTQGMLGTLIFAGVLALLTSVVRVRWLAVGIAATIFAFSRAQGPPQPFDIAAVALLSVVWTITVMRTGLVTGVAMAGAYHVLRSFPAVAPGSSWYWPVSAVGFGALALLAGLGFWLARGRSVLTVFDELPPPPPTRSRPADFTSAPTAFDPASTPTVASPPPGSAT